MRNLASSRISASKKRTMEHISMESGREMGKHSSLLTLRLNKLLLRPSVHLLQIMKKLYQQWRLQRMSGHLCLCLRVEKL